MKRIFAFLLAAVLALSLCACSSEPNKYQALNDMLDRGDYDAAMQYIENIAGGKTTTGNGNGDGNTTTTTDNNDTTPSQNVGQEESVNAPLLPLFYGQWDVMSEQDDQPYTITVNADGTCLIGEEALSWKLSSNYSQSETYLYAEVYEGVTSRYTLRMHKRVDLARVELMLGVTENGSSQYSDDHYRNDAHYRIVPITKENWKEYFDFFEVPDFQKNAFGEFEDFRLLTYIGLKEGQRENFCYEYSDVAMELSYTYGDRGCVLDIENETYTLTDQYVADRGGERETAIFDFYGSSDYGYSTQLMHCWYYPDRHETPSYSRLGRYFMDLQLERVQGSLYFLNIEE